MRGKEESGVRHADRRIFEGGNYIVTPTAKNTETAIETCAALGQRYRGKADIAVIARKTR